MRQKQRDFSLFLLSPSSRRAWIEIIGYVNDNLDSMLSPSSRRAWIEIQKLFATNCQILVALLAEGVDRNFRCRRSPRSAGPVALLAEGVDRNSSLCVTAKRSKRSPSSRRAWIEIEKLPPFEAAHRVALLAEGVDRNSGSPLAKTRTFSSPSSRRAWIEIQILVTRLIC